MYKFDLHVHSAPVSACAVISSADIADNFIKNGYQGIVLTNHISPFNYLRLQDRLKTWDDIIDFFMNDYHTLVSCAKDKLTVLLGAEISFEGMFNDYLVYGITEDFLRRNPYLYKQPYDKFIPIMQEEGFLVFQAHPLRYLMTIIPPSICNGIEVYNSCIRHDSRNDIAAQWAKKFNLKTIAGSDTHLIEDVGTGGIITKTPILNNNDLFKIINEQDFEIIKR